LSQHNALISTRDPEARWRGAGTEKGAMI